VPAVARGAGVTIELELALAGLEDRGETDGEERKDEARARPMLDVR
jgi:hypothetical protein